MADKTILVVDDVQHYRDRIKHSLSSLGCKIDEADDGLAAWKLVESNNYDVIISDYRMPEKDGFWLLNQINEHLKHRPPFYFCTSFAMYDSDAYRIGAQGYFAKDEIELLAKFVSLHVDREQRYEKTQAKSSGVLPRFDERQANL